MTYILTYIAFYMYMPEVTSAQITSSNCPSVCMHVRVCVCVNVCLLSASEHLLNKTDSIVKKGKEKGRDRRSEEVKKEVGY